MQKSSKALRKKVAQKYQKIGKETCEKRIEKKSSKVLGKRSAIKIASNNAKNYAGKLAKITQ